MASGSSCCWARVQVHVSSLEGFRWHRHAAWSRDCDVRFFCMHAWVLSLREYSRNDSEFARPEVDVLERLACADISADVCACSYNCTTFLRVRSSRSSTRPRAMPGQLNWLALELFAPVVGPNSAFVTTASGELRHCSSRLAYSN